MIGFFSLARLEGRAGTCLDFSGIGPHRALQFGLGSGSGLTTLLFRAQNSQGFYHKKSLLGIYRVLSLLGLVRELGPGSIGYWAYLLRALL